MAIMSCEQIIGIDNAHDMSQARKQDMINVSSLAGAGRRFEDCVFKILKAVFQKPNALFWCV